MDDDPSSVTYHSCRSNNVTVAGIHNLTIDNTRHRSSIDVENNNDSGISTNSSQSSSMFKMNQDIQNLNFEDNISFIRSPPVKPPEISMAYKNVEGDDGFSKVIVNIIDDDGNLDHQALLNEEYKNEGAFSPKSLESHPRTPRSKSNSLNSDQLISHLRYLFKFSMRLSRFHKKLSVGH